MRHLSFSLVIPSDDESFQALISTEGIDIERVAFLGGDSDRVHVLYSLHKENIEDEKDRLKTLIERARLVNLAEYHEFKNAKQRELFLLSKYSIGGKEGQDIQELLKPEMAGILNGGSPDV